MLMKSAGNKKSGNYLSNGKNKISFACSARRLIFNDYKPQQRLAQICLARLDGWKQCFHSTIVNKINICLIALDYFGYL
ncbi:hypothetical protein D917_07082 [Trichinella nativa]|uniref:Uncharacterized protein n=1 Tax=Trichinella nativa TaxID=6335 RepID=A0A1Y3EQ27_9BILA|nr:hypothetical protein D917_07082 [Trichinella nativa]